MLSRLIICVCCFLFTSAFAQREDLYLPTEEDYYKIITLPIPDDVVLEVGGLATLPNGDLAVSTRRGEVWTVENPYLHGGAYPHFRRFASGLHEILGLAYRDGSLYMAQRGELTQLTDNDGDGQADVYKTVYSWPLSGHYHEYSFGPKFAPDGSMFVTANVAFGDIEWWRGESRVPWRGWTMHITPAGDMTPYATGMRSPCGIGLIDGEFFYADNQGDWIGSGGLVHVEKGDFTGHPAGLRWAEHPASPVELTTNEVYYRANPRFAPRGQRPTMPKNIEDETPLPLFELAEELPAIKLPAVWLPHGILGISLAEIIQDTTGGRFGPFGEQLFIADQGQSKIIRVFLEKVKGVYQGAAFDFREGFQCGILRMAYGRDGSLFVGQTERGWGSVGDEPYGLQRVLWSGQTPFEMRAIRAMPDGFELEFTQPVDKESVLAAASYAITGFTYKYHPVYGSPIVNQQTCPVRHAVVSDDGLRVRLVVDSLRQFYVHEIKAEGIRSYNGELPLLHPTGYYTLNQIPEGDTLAIPEPSTVEKSAAHAHHTMSANADKQMGEKTTSPVKKQPTTAKTSRSAPARNAKHQTRQPASWAKVDETIVMSTLPGMRFDRSLVTVKAGSRVKFTFYNNDDMPHNIAFTTVGGIDAVAKAANALGLDGPAQSYIPALPQVLYHSTLLGPGASETIYFEAPQQPGSYSYVCTFPGHAATMRGTLRVLP